MTPELLEQYLAKLKQANMMTFRMKLEGVELEGSFAPEVPKELEGLGFSEPGGWKTPALDNFEPKGA